MTKTVEQIQELLDKGLSKSEIARELGISRSTLINLLNNPELHLSETTLSRIKHNLALMQQRSGKTLVESLIFLRFHTHNATKYFNHFIEVTEKTTGLETGYHGYTLGGPSAFAFVQSTGLATLTHTLAKIQTFLPEGLFGYTETLFLGDEQNFEANHEEACHFYNSHPNARIYLKVFKSMSFSAYRDLQKISEIFDKQNNDEVFCLKRGLLSGKYDYFILVIAKDENAYLQFLAKPRGIYDALKKSNVDTHSITVAPKMLRMEREHKNLSFGSQDVIPQNW